MRESAKKKLRARSSLFFSFERKKRRTKTNTKRFFFCETRHKSERCDETSTETMINADGDNVDLYIPRKCSWTNRLITCKDHAAIQVNVGHLGPDGTYTGNYSTFAISGYVRNKVRCREVQLRMQYYLWDALSRVLLESCDREWLNTARFRVLIFPRKQTPL